MNKIIGCAVGAVMLFGASVCNAAVLNFSSIPGSPSIGSGSYTGSMTWTYLGSGAGSLSVSLTNTSPAANGGYMTGFAFNTVGGLTMALTSGRAGFTFISPVSASPFEPFDVGAALGGNWLGGGNPTAGIGVGVTDTFVFGVSGAHSLLSTLSEVSFFDLDASGQYRFAARFRGFNDGSSAKVVGEFTPVPIPVPLAIAAAGLLSVVAVRRRNSARVHG